MTENDAAIVDRLTPDQKVGLTLYGEIRNGNEAAILAVGSAILNRVKAKRASFGLTPEAVVLKRHQFSCWNDDPDTPNDEAVMKAAVALVEGRPVDSRLRLCLLVGEGIVAATLRDTVNGATHYYSPRGMVPKGRVPIWAKGLKPVADIGGHLFFVGVQ